MQYRLTIATALSLLLAIPLSAAAAGASKLAAPQAFPHSVALFLADLSNNGSKRVTYRASAVGTHFFFEEPLGVTVYVYDGEGYKKETFLPRMTLQTALKKYRRKK